MKFDLDVRWNKSGQWVTLQSGEGEERLEHTWIGALGHICLRLIQQVEVSLGSKNLSYTLLPAAFGWSSLKKGSNVR